MSFAAVYKKLPFYNLLTNVTQAYAVSGTSVSHHTSLITACPTSRTTQPIQVRLTPEMLNKLTPKGPSNPYRLVLFSTQTDRVPYGNCVIEFPAHAEIRCNGSPVTANLRGIKNKPGTVNPPDITGQAILMAAVTNKVDVTLAESRTSYTLVIYLVEKNTVSQLVEKIRKRGFISKESTLNKSILKFVPHIDGSEGSGTRC
jgi:PINIT domain